MITAVSPGVVSVDKFVADAILICVHVVAVPDVVAKAAPPVSGYIEVESVALAASLTT
jgi:hypothetical protein